MAVLAAAALLDELMGRNRNIAPNDKGKELNWEDPEVGYSYRMLLFVFQDILPFPTFTLSCSNIGFNLCLCLFFQFFCSTVSCIW